MKEIKDGIKVEGLHLRAPFNLERVSFTLPPPDDDSILIKVRLCGICSTDVAMFVGELPPLPKEMFGHEAVGEVVWKGKNIKDVEVGDYVSCYWHPGYATYLIAPKGTYIKVPELSIKWNLQPIACVLNCLFLLPFGKICGDGVLVIGRFQSHNGAIAASIVVGCDAHNRFQSHNGAIAAGQGEWEILLRPGFNPTMVRLLRFVGYAALMLPCLVSIPQWCDCCLIRRKIVRSQRKFQSHNGAIAAFALYSATRTSA